MKLKKGDEVEVLSGKDRGKRGVIMRVLAKDDRVIVEGVNVAKKHQRQTKARVKGGIIDKDMPVHASTVALVCPQGRAGAGRLPVQDRGRSPQQGAGLQALRAGAVDGDGHHRERPRLKVRYDTELRAELQDELWTCPT